jgi:hypothetical protein
MEPYYEEAEEMLQVSGPLTYPWGRRRSRYPRRAHELNAAAIVLVRGCEKLGIPWSAAPVATLSSPRGLAHPCVYRGFCVIGCSTNAKQSVLVTWIPRALEAGAEIRDLAMVAGSRSITHAAPRAFTTTGKANGGFNAPATSSSPATASKRRDCS